MVIVRPVHNNLKVHITKFGVEQIVKQFLPWMFMAVGIGKLI